MLTRELETALLALPSEINTKEHESTRLRLNYEPANHGAAMSWIPKSHELRIKNRLEKTASNQSIVKRIENVFDHEIST